MNLDRLPFGFSTMIVGLSIVFMILIFIMVFINLQTKLVKLFEDKKKKSTT